MVSPFQRGPSGLEQRQDLGWAQARGEQVMGFNREYLGLPQRSPLQGGPGLQPAQMYAGGSPQGFRPVPERTQFRAPMRCQFGGAAPERQWPRGDRFDGYGGRFAVDEGMRRDPGWQRRGPDLVQVGLQGVEDKGGHVGQGEWGQMEEPEERRELRDRRGFEWDLPRRGVGMEDPTDLRRGARTPASPIGPPAELPRARSGQQYGVPETPRRDRWGRAEAVPMPKEIEDRFAAIESMRRTEMVRSATSSELRRMLSAISPVDHPGIYTTVDQFVTLHECPPSHRGPMSVAGACGGVLKEPHIKLAFLAEATWQFARRKCAEAGENLTEQQVQEIEAQILEFYGKQKVEGSKILDKAGIIPGRGNR
jgi:hypothetical protein